MKRKPRVLTKCVANHFAAADERVIEFSFPGSDGYPGGLISFSTLADGTPTVQLYRVSPGVRVIVSHDGRPSVCCPPEPVESVR